MTDADLDKKTRVIVHQLQTHADAFPAPDPSLDVVRANLEAFTDAVSDASTGDRLKIIIREAKKEALVNTLHLLSAWCAYICRGDLMTAEMSGFTLARPRTSLPPIAKPENVQVQNTNQSGAMKVSVDAVAGAAAYVYQYTTDEALKAENWKAVNCSQSKCTIQGLQPGTRYYFSVAAIGRKSQVTYSEVVSRITT